MHERPVIVSEAQTADRLIIIIIFIFRYKHNKITENSHTIGGLPEKLYSSLTGCPSKKINLLQMSCKLISRAET